MGVLSARRKKLGTKEGEKTQKGTENQSWEEFFALSLLRGLLKVKRLGGREVEWTPGTRGDHNLKLVCQERKEPW